MKDNRIKSVLIVLMLLAFIDLPAITIQNIMGRERTSLNGKWQILTDAMNVGARHNWYNPLPNNGNKKFNELRYSNEETLNVPGDWNSQKAEFYYYNATMWYKKDFFFKRNESKRYFIYFGAVNYHANVYVNGNKIGEHTGGFTPFDFEVTDILKDGSNNIIVEVNNTITKNTVPTISGWFNCGGITRDVDLVSVPHTYIRNYWVRLAKGSMKKVIVDVQLDGDNNSGREITVTIGNNIKKRIQTDFNGKASISFDEKLNLWSPENPFLYDITISNENEIVKDKIGFRCFEIKNNKIFLNSKPLFLRGVCTHEEIASESRRAYSQSDADFLVKNIKELGCNFVRLAHYPYNEYMIRACEANGILMWEEIPVWQNIDFKSQNVCELITTMIKELIDRDKNRCGTIIWSISNETRLSKERNEFLSNLIDTCHVIDDTRAISAAIDLMKVNGNKLEMFDVLAKKLDIIGINKYMGWYSAWPTDPTKMQWITDSIKPMMISEFGAGAVYGIRDSGNDVNTFSEDYMANVYNQDISSFRLIPNIVGVSPWNLFDFRYPGCSNAKFQKGWNRKGLISPEGKHKEAWYIMNKWYNQIKFTGKL